MGNCAKPATDDNAYEQQPDPYANPPPQPDGYGNMQPPLDGGAPPAVDQGVVSGGYSADAGYGGGGGGGGYGGVVPAPLPNPVPSGGGASTGATYATYEEAQAAADAANAASGGAGASQGYNPGYGGGGGGGGYGGADGGYTPYPPVDPGFGVDPMPMPVPPNNEAQAIVNTHTAMDTNHDGVVDLPEALAAGGYPAPGPKPYPPGPIVGPGGTHYPGMYPPGPENPQNIVRKFEKTDLNNDGVVTVGEALAADGWKLGGPVPQPVPYGGSTAYPTATAYPAGGGVGGSTAFPTAAAATGAAGGSTAFQASGRPQPLPAPVTSVY